MKFYLKIYYFLALILIEIFYTMLELKIRQGQLEHKTIRSIPNYNKNLVTLETIQIIARINNNND